ncbi:MAG: hypothetical protein JKY92_10480, partial [Magnetovibrio sp.]|nr:hypothetical protein [Magnetovibrio sp.]
MAEERTGMAVERPGQKSNSQKDSALGALGLTLPEGDESTHFGHGVPPQTPLEFNEFKQPFYLRHRLLSIAGVALTVGWLSLSSWYIDTYVGWGLLTELLPHEIGGLAAGVFTPLALLWMVVALFERGHNMRGETAHLRWQIQQLTYPSDQAQSRVKDITDVLRRQSQDLSKASDEAITRAEIINDQVRERALELSKVSEDADLRSRAVAEALSRQTEDLRQVSIKAEARARSVGDTLHRHTHDIVKASDRASARAEDVADVLESRVKELSDVA